MRLPVIPIISLAISLFASCGPGESDSNKEKNPDSPGDKVDPTLDEEDETALEPAEVSGAFLTAIGSPGGDTVPAKAGFRPVGANIFLAKTGAKVTDPVAFTQLKFTGTSGDTLSVSPETPPGYSEFQAVFYVPEATPEPIPGLELVVSVNESQEFSLTGDSVSRGSVALPTASPGANTNAPDPLENVSVHQIYVTNGRFRPGIDFKNVRDANQLCNKEAALDPALDTVWWKAVLADESQTIAARIPLYGAVEDLLGNQLIAADSALASAEIEAGALQFANFGTVGAGENNLVFTGSKKDGSIGETCSGWSSAAGNATAGSPASGVSWIESTSVGCDKARRLYCISSKKKSVQP